MHRSSLVLGLVLASSGAASIQAQPASFQGLGFGAARALSADGRVVVSNNGAGGVIRWTAPGGPITLTGTGSWSAGALSSDGSVIVGQEWPEAARWSSPTGVVSQGFGQGYTDGSWGTGVSADGQIMVGGMSRQTNTWCSILGQFGHYLQDTRAFRQTAPDGPLHKLPPLPGYDSCLAHGVSSDSALVVGHSWSGCFSAQQEACVWIGGGQPIPLGFLPGGGKSSASAAAADGSAVVGWSTWNSGGVGGTHAFRWTPADGMTDLGGLAGVHPHSDAADISADGGIVVGICQGGPGPSVPFVWDQAHGMRDLTAVLQGLGLNLAGWTLTSATGVSADGRTIAGNGTNPGGHPEAWIAFLGEAVCYPDCNADGTLTVADFGCFQTKFVAGDPYADCNGDTQLTVADFGCFQTTFVAGCP